jgi:hypothetical protein
MGPGVIPRRSLHVRENLVSETVPVKLAKRCGYDAGFRHCALQEFAPAGIGRIGVAHFENHLSILGQRKVDASNICFPRSDIATRFRTRQ